MTPIRPKLVHATSKAAAVNIVDALNDQIQFAGAILLAVMGAAELVDFESEPISRLIETHIERLEAIAASVTELRGTL